MSNISMYPVTFRVRRKALLMGITNKHLFFCLGLLLGHSLCLAQPLVWPGTRISRIEGKNLVAFVPEDQAKKLVPLVAKADRLYGVMLRESCFRPASKLYLLLGNWKDDHNGYSFVVPFPLVEVDLSRPRPGSNIFQGYGVYERTFAHEFAHQISNDRNYGMRKTLESLFGRVVPMDPLSAVVWYLSTPSHQTMPAFWHEGLAIWAETEYAGRDTIWRGRGADPLVHMVWRLDVKAGRTPPPSEWRLTWQEWPYGDRAYLYGAAYFRYLAAILPGRKAIWKLIENQGKGWPFFFNDAPLSVLHKTHLELIAKARRSLVDEQKEIIQRIEKAGETRLERLTPGNMLLGAPAWLPGGELAFMGKERCGRPRLYIMTKEGKLIQKGETGHALGNIRSLPDGRMIWAEYNWRRISRLFLDGKAFGWRLVQPDIKERPGKDLLVAAVRFNDDGSQELVLLEVDQHSLEIRKRRSLDTRGLPWSPAFRPGGTNEILWTETTKKGSRLVLSSIERPRNRKILLELKGRIMHPAWTRDGRFVFFCSDHTGVANAWRLEVSKEGKTLSLLPVTNTVGGVIACVPSFDGKTLALVDHDGKGPFIAKMANDPSLYAIKIPSIEIRWPAPIGKERPAAQKTGESIRETRGESHVDYEPEHYSGLFHMKPLFWSPSTLPVPEGGIGVFGAAADTLLTHIIAAGAGFGIEEWEPVGYLGYACLSEVIEFRAQGWRSERTFYDRVVDAAGREYDYTETADTLEISVGRGLAGLERRFLAYLSFGIEHHGMERSSARKYRGRTLVSPPRFRGTERYLQAVIGFDNATFFPTSYAPEDGLEATLEMRHSGLGGDLERNRVFFNSSYCFSIFPEEGIQVVLGGQAGWSDGKRTLQGDFTIGGSMSRGLPRGYMYDTYATGKYLAAGSLAFRFPLVRPFQGISTTPFRMRQVAMEVFSDTAKVSTDHVLGNNKWYSSVGSELHLDMEFRSVILCPGLGIAKQLEGDRDWNLSFALGFRF